LTAFRCRLVNATGDMSIPPQMRSGHAKGL
jgi:hypothetical protein